MQIIHLNITVSGNVQGVGFRFHTISTARSLGIKGFVKNLSDGNVYIEAEGLPENIDKFVYWCNQGPSRARVTDVSTSKGEVVNFKAFDVKY